MTAKRGIENWQPQAPDPTTHEILDTNWDTAPQEIAFLSAALEFFGPVGRNQPKLFRLLDSGVDETWFIHPNRRFLYLGLFSASLKITESNTTVRLGAVIDEAEKISKETGWAVEEIRRICETVGYFKLDEFLEQDIPLWWHKLKKPKTIALLGKMNHLLVNISPTLESLNEIDELAAQALDTWRAEPSVNPAEEKLHFDVRNECLKPLPLDHTIAIGVDAIDQALNGGVGGHSSPDAGRLIVVCARPGAGKSLVAGNIASRLAVRGCKAVLWSFEMGRNELAMRDIAMKDFFYCREQGLSDPITYNNLKRRAYTNAQRDRLVAQTYEKLDENFSILIGSPKMTPEYVTNHMRSFARRHPSTRLFIIDHLGLMNIPTTNRAVEVGEATRLLKVTARQLGIDVLLLCQLNRGVESREDKRPTLSDLRDSGRIEEDSDIVLGLYRPAYYKNDDPTLDNILEIISLKNRQGQSNYVLETGVYLDSCSIVNPGSRSGMEPTEAIPDQDGDFL
jgi:KaiC/GvpD/RAD55 family RecA-like ATPase